MGLNDSLLAAADYILSLKAAAVTAGWLKTYIGDGTNTAEIKTAGADGVSNTGNRLAVSAWGKIFNGTTWDRIRAGVVTPSATLTGIQTVLGWALYSASPTTRTDGQAGPLQASARGALKFANDELFPGEDAANGVIKVEGQFSYTRCTADTQVKASAGYLKRLIFQATDAVPTAGTIIVYDNTAESGTVVCTMDVKATAALSLDSVVIVDVEAIMATGIYVGFTTTADVACTAVWR